MNQQAPGHRLSAATAIDRGDRLYQQDQVEVYAHARVAGCMLAVLADGMGGKSGGRKAADQVLLIAQQLFERFVPGKDSAPDLLRRLVEESHLLIKLTAITSEQEPHSTIAAALILPNRECHIIHAGDSRVYVFRGPQLLSRTMDHSLVQRLLDQGEITEDEARDHPHGHLLTGCLGADEDPPISPAVHDELLAGDSVLLCSDGLWHYFTPRELGTIAHALKPRDASKMLIAKARQRARGGGDNVSLALLKVDPLG